MSGLLCLLVCLLSFLLTEGMSPDFPLDREAAGIHASLHESHSRSGHNSDTRVIGDELDVCLPLPVDPDPSDHNSGMALHIDTHARKDALFLPQPAKAPSLRLYSGGIPQVSRTAGFRRTEPAALPFFREYPVFLICDLPPPAA